MQWSRQAGRQAGKQEVAHGAILVGMQLRVRDHVRLIFPVFDTPPLASR
jgi:hypothetical protein